MLDTETIGTPDADQAETVTHKIIIHALPFGVDGPGRRSRSRRYRVDYRGETLIERTKVPFYDSARALAALGLAGRLEVWRPNVSYPAMVAEDLRKAAEWTVREDDRGLRLVRWAPRPGLSADDAE